MLSKNVENVKGTTYNKHGNTKKDEKEGKIINTIKRLDIRGKVEERRGPGSRRMSWLKHLEQ